MIDKTLKVSLERRMFIISEEIYNINKMKSQSQGYQEQTHHKGNEMDQKAIARDEYSKAYNNLNRPDCPLSEAELLAALYERESELERTKQQLHHVQCLLEQAEQRLAERDDSRTVLTSGMGKLDKHSYEIQLQKAKEIEEDLLMQINDLKAGSESNLLRKYKEEREKNQNLLLQVEKWKNKLIESQKGVRSSSIKKNIGQKLAKDSFMEPVKLEINLKEKNQLLQKIRELKKQIDDRDRQIRKLNNYCEQAEIGLKEETSRAANYEETVTSYQEKIALFSQETWRLNEMTAKMRKDLAEKNARIAAFEDLQHEINKQNQNIKIINSILESRLEDIQEMKRSIHHYIEVQEKNNLIMQEMEKLQQAYNVKIQQCQQMHEHIYTLSEQIMNLEHTIHTLRYDMSEEQGRYKEMVKAVQVDKEHMRMNYEGLLQSKDKEQTQALKQILHCQQMLQKIQIKHQKVNQRIDQLHQVLRSLKAEYQERLEQIRLKEAKHQKLLNDYAKMEISLHNLAEDFMNTKQLQKAFIKSIKICKIQQNPNDQSMFDHREIEEAGNFMRAPLFANDVKMREEQFNRRRENSVNKNSLEVRNSREINNITDSRHFNSPPAMTYLNSSGVRGNAIYNTQYQHKIDNSPLRSSQVSNNRTHQTIQNDHQYTGNSQKQVLILNQGDLLLNTPSFQNPSIMQYTEQQVHGQGQNVWPVSQRIMNPLQEMQRMPPNHRLPNHPPMPNQPNQPTNHFTIPQNNNIRMVQNSSEKYIHQIPIDRNQQNGMNQFQGMNPSHTSQQMNQNRQQSPGQYRFYESQMPYGQPQNVMYQSPQARNIVYSSAQRKDVFLSNQQTQMMRSPPPVQKRPFSPAKQVPNDERMFPLKKAQGSSFRRISVSSKQGQEPNMRMVSPPARTSGIKPKSPFGLAIHHRPS